LTESNRKDKLKNEKRRHVASAHRCTQGSSGYCLLWTEKWI